MLWIDFCGEETSFKKFPPHQTVDQKSLTPKQMPRCECFSAKTEEDFEK